ncbi:hypothetical protein [Streptomyces buecherae]|uniref:Uncharacterized protein n=1 Tax=Streptomyces buecherae TaxID=2763006 RepID=A0A7H8NF91_9ACTN|nr:hypothetical protein [Streptomyces buecherae]QKW53056.1 hypothetical protein HUT08_29880 [Streptomyces buecherae]
MPFSRTTEAVSYASSIRGIRPLAPRVAMPAPGPVGGIATAGPAALWRVGSDEDLTWGG